MDDDGAPTPNTMLANDYQIVGAEIIRQACASAMEPDGPSSSSSSSLLQKVDVEWKGSRIIVTLRAENLYLSAVNDDDDEDENNKNNDEAKGNENPKSTTTKDYNNNNKGGVDVTTIARAINAALDSNPTGQAIAQRYSIEVTTPGASDELQGDVMFRAYQGFDVTVLYRDPKKNNQPKTVVGRLVERNDEHVIINVKGRMSKLIRDNVVSVTLPKAKQEK